MLKFQKTRAVEAVVEKAEAEKEVAMAADLKAVTEENVVTEEKAVAEMIEMVVKEALRKKKALAGVSSNRSFQEKEGEKVNQTVKERAEKEDGLRISTSIQSKLVVGITQISPLFEKLL